MTTDQLTTLRVPFADRHPVFLDFMSPDNRVMYGTYANYSRAAHVAALAHALDVAVLLGNGRCLLPPSFITQCDIARAALTQRRVYLAAGLIQFPLRESSLADFFLKKRLEYGHVRAAYDGLFRRGGQVFIMRHAQHIVRRHFRVGVTVAANWESGPDTSFAWRRVLPLLTADDVRELRRVPRRLKAKGIALTAQAIRAAHRTPLSLEEIDAILQQEYVRLYVARFDARVITNLPPKTFELDLQQVDLSYNYHALQAALGPMDLWPQLLSVPPIVLLRLHDTEGFQRFIAAFEFICRGSVTPSKVHRVFVALADGGRAAIRQTAEVIEKVGHGMNETDLRELVDAVQSRLACLVAPIAFPIITPSGITQIHTSGGLMATKAVAADIAIIVALEKERDAVVHWLQRGEANTWSDRGWHRWTDARGRRFVLVCSGAGPLSSATVAQQVIAATRPTYLFLVGIAAGLHRDVELGDVIVAEQIVDYEAGKQTPGAMKRRWAVYRSDPQLLSIARSVGSEWSLSLAPLRPDGDGRHLNKAHFGSLLSGAKVIADAAFTDVLRQVWADAAAVYAATADDHAPRFAAIKAVSDRGDVTKDDRWQEYASAAAALFLSKVVERIQPSPAAQFESPVPTYIDIPLRTAGTGSTAEANEPLVLQLEPLLRTHMNMAELQLLAFRVNLDWEDMPGTTKMQKVIELLQMAQRRRRLAKLVEELRKLRPELVDEPEDSGPAPVNLPPGLLKAQPTAAAVDWETYRRREAARERYQAFILMMPTSGDNMEAIRLFGEDIQVAEDLFGKPIYMYLDTTYKKAADLYSVREQKKTAFARSLPQREIEALISAENALVAWFTAQYGELREMLAPFFNLADRMPAPTPTTPSSAQRPDEPNR
jgi:adenosylhomocysteine nucleosidase